VAQGGPCHRNRLCTSVERTKKPRGLDIKKERGPRSWGGKVSGLSSYRAKKGPLSRQVGKKTAVSLRDIGGGRPNSRRREGIGIGAFSSRGIYQSPRRGGEVDPQKLEKRGEGRADRGTH